LYFYEEGGTKISEINAYQVRHSANDGNVFADSETVNNPIFSMYFINQNVSTRAALS
jgi:hypothetical protein